MIFNILFNFKDTINIYNIIKFFLIINKYVYCN